MFQNQKLVNTEYFFFSILILLLFILNAFDKGELGFQTHKALYTFSYACSAIFINYLLIPKFLYKKKILIFSLLLLLSIAVVIIFEEFVIEKLLLANTHGRGFNILWTLLDVLPPLAFLVGFKFSWDAIQKQKKIDSLNRSIAESELQFLSSQINPHFLFNNLNNLYSFAISKSPKTPELILQLSSILRYMLYECQAVYVPLNNEIKQLHNFIHLGELQIEGRGSVKLTKDIPQNTLKIAPLLLIVFIENAFKHSASSQTEDINIEIDIKVDYKDTLIFNCKNSFQEDSNTNSLSQGIGLQNVRKRLELLYPKAHRLNILTSDNIFNVELELQLSPKND